MADAACSMPGDEVAVARDDVSGAAAVPRHAAVEDVAEAVPLRRALQRHGDDVVGAADAVREALLAGRGIRAGVEHRVHRVGAAAPALLRAVHVERLRQREARAAAHEGRRARTRLASSMKLRVPSTSSSPQRPQLRNASAASATSPVGVGAVELLGSLGRRAPGSGCRGGRAHRVASSATHRTVCAPSPSIAPTITSPSRSIAASARCRCRRGCR